MKKTFFFFMSLNCMMIQAQELFKLEKTLKGQYNIQLVQYDDDDNFVAQLSFHSLSTPTCDIGYLYNTECNGKTFTINLISPDYEVSTKQYTFDLPNGYELQSCYPTNKLTSDKSLMFLNTYSNGTLYSCGLYNSKGKLVQSFVNGVKYANAYPMLYRINGRYRLLVWRANFSGSTLKYETDIYTAQNQTSQISSVKEARFEIIPTLSNNIVSIPYSNNINNYPLLIFDGNGIIIESQKVNTPQGTININIATYRSGVYIYRIGEQTGKFVVN